MKKLIGKYLTIIIPLIAAAFLLYPTYRASDLEKLKNQTIELAMKDKTPADSLARMERFEEKYGKDLESAKSKRIKLGLDLRGGMYVTLEIDVAKLIEESAQREAVDETFREVIQKTRDEAKLSDKPVLDIFLANFEKIARKRGKSLITYFDIGDLKEASEQKIIDKLKRDADAAIEQAQQVIRQRIDKFGIAEPTIQKQGNRRIMLELPGVKNEVEMRKLLQTTARLEFNLVRNNKNIVKIFFKIDQILKEQALRRKGLGEFQTTETAEASKTFTPDATQTTGNDTAKDTTSTASDSTATDSTTAAKDTANPYAGLSETETQKRYLADHPFTALFQTFYISQNGEKSESMPVNYIRDEFPEGEYNFMIPEASLKRFNEILARAEIRALIPFDIKILRDAKPEERFKKQEKSNIYSFYALKADPELTGECITDARATFDPTTNQPMVTMGMNTDGSERWARITGANLKKRVAIILDEQVYTAPTVQSKITGGNSQITGMANAEEAHLLEIVLKAGALKAPVQIIEERIVGPSLGDDSIKSGLTASLIAILVVVFFMIMYYAKGGIVADFSVILNVIIIIAVLAAFGGTLTLPGIGGIILTIGMAVDANVLIYERIREELWRGRSLRSAVDEGFSKAMSAIIDSNVTTFLSGLILFYFGSGPIQGFAMTLMIGILATLFTQIVVSRAVIEIILSRGGTHFSFGQPKHIQQQN